MRAAWARGCNGHCHWKPGDPVRRSPVWDVTAPPETTCSGVVPRTGGAVLLRMRVPLWDRAALVGGDLVSTLALTARRSEPRTQVGLVNHPATTEMALTEARRLLLMFRSRTTGLGGNGGLSTCRQQDRRCALVPGARGVIMGLAIQRGADAMPSLGRNRVASTLVEDLEGALADGGSTPPASILPGPPDTARHACVHPPSRAGRDKQGSRWAIPLHRREWQWS